MAGCLSSSDVSSATIEVSITSAHTPVGATSRTESVFPACFAASLPYLFGRFIRSFISTFLHSAAAFPFLSSTSFPVPFLHPVTRGIVFFLANFGSRWRHCRSCSGRCPDSCGLHSYDSSPSHALWSGTTKNRDVSTGPLRSSFRSFARTAHSFTMLARSAALIHSFARSLPSSWKKGFCP